MKKKIIICSFIFVICMFFYFYYINSAKYTISFKTGTNEKISEIKVKKNTLYKINKVPEREDFVFLYWEYAGKKMKIGEKIKVVSDMELVAVWTKNNKVDKNIQNNNKNKETQETEKNDSLSIEKSKENNNTLDYEQNIQKQLPLFRYYCEENFNLINNKCRYEETIKSQKKKVCEDGFKLNGILCEKPKPVSKVDEALLKYNSIKWDEENRDKSEKEIFEIACIKVDGIFSEEEYINGTNLWCYYYNGTRFMYTAPEVSYCEEGYLLENEECKKIIEKEALKELYCSEGFILNNSECVEKR